MNSDRKILIFAGAGASKAVASDLYPTTIEFFDELPPATKSNSLFSMIEKFVRKNRSDVQIDIELILWRLQELREFCSQAVDQSQLPGWALGRLSEALELKGQNVGHLDTIARTAESKLKRLIGEINARVYGLYSKVPTSQQLQNNWTPLLDGLSRLEHQVDIVTTNYDMIIESALDGNKLADTGWRGNVIRSVDTELWTADSGTREKGLLTKLHGSVNWTRKDENQIYVSDPLFKGSHDAHVIIYPGFKGRPSDPTFQIFHSYFQKSLAGATVVIFIGFAFRDDYINDICERSITTQTSTFVINPQKVPIPFKSGRHHYLEKPFDEHAVAQAVKFAKEVVVN